MTATRALLIGLAVLLAAPALGQSERESEKLELREGERADERIELDASQVENGALVYASRCTICHGADLGGSTRRVEGRAVPEIVVPPLGLTGYVWRYPEPMLKNLIVLGEAALIEHRSPATMPAHRTGLKPDEVDAVIAFIKAHWTPWLRFRQAENTAKAKEVERRFDQGLPLLPDRRSGE